MMSILGIPIGIYGYLLPGNINLMVLHLARTKRLAYLSLVMFLILLFESLYCLGTLQGVKYLFKHPELLLKLKIFAGILTLLMGIWMLIEKKSEEKTTKHTLQRGLFSVIVHPQQIGFWLFVFVLFPNIFEDLIAQKQLFYFVLYNAIGTFIIVALYAVLGHKLLRWFKLKLSILNSLLGVVYVLTGLQVLWTLLLA